MKAMTVIACICGIFALVPAEMLIMGAISTAGLLLFALVCLLTLASTVAAVYLAGRAVMGATKHNEEVRQDDHGIQQGAAAEQATVRSSNRVDVVN